MENPVTRKKNLRGKRLQIAGVVLTILGLCLFAYFIYKAGIAEIWDNISKLGWGFALILALFGLKLATRVWAWMLSVEKPYKLSFATGFRAMVIGESLSAMIPLGILISGTAKAIAVRKELPIVAGLSSIAVENLFYSLATAILIFCGALAFLINFELTGGLLAVDYVLLAAVPFLVIVGFLAVIYEWRLASWLAEWLYGKGLATRILHDGRAEIRKFEDLILQFYQNEAKLFLPIILLEIAFHALGVLEVWLILRAVSAISIDIGAAFLLETANRIILVVFKLIPFLLGVDEAAARFVTKALGVGTAVGMTLAIVRKGRVLFWTAIGVILIVRSGFSIKEVMAEADLSQTAGEIQN
jgi:hypothetical protein